MTNAAIDRIKTGTKIGALVGGIGFMILGMVPGFHYGGYGTLMLLNKVAGGPLEMTLGVRMLLTFGVLMGILCVASMSIVLGSVIGTASGYVVNLLSPAKAPETQEG